MGFDPHRVRRRRHIRHFYAGCGWLVYFAGWARVLPRTPKVEIWSFGLVFLASVILIHASAAAWIGHNKRIASRGKRGLSTRYMSPNFSTDHLDRPLLVDRDARDAAEVTVSVKGPAKLYVAYVGVEEEVAMEVGAD
ncbi:hypothetical protein Acid345_3361 [Candidatus Koribacter versatilis Ellin345]|uniref:Uncharacterized protein n=1 Tax=Koribacter versatilis (strain Ellin345) TaxID=204669 RepID=Q1IL88_KORVE|nr:hypothetical protein [Candidatus Koribacter versatilis]ABF42362.1 hypothetical protein Acid345_3361 [Candidatus Koribacter versatilis Ellin345]